MVPDCRRADHDGEAPHQITFPRGALRLADLGYFSLEVWRTLTTSGGYWLSRLYQQTSILTPGGVLLD